MCVCVCVCEKLSVCLCERTRAGHVMGLPVHGVCRIHAPEQLKCANTRFTASILTLVTKGSMTHLLHVERLVLRPSEWLSVHVLMKSHLAETRRGLLCLRPAQGVRI
jgi:hypothetical protein